MSAVGNVAGAGIATIGSLVALGIVANTAQRVASGRYGGSGRGYQRTRKSSNYSVFSGTKSRKKSYSIF